MNALKSVRIGTRPVLGFVPVRLCGLLVALFRGGLCRPAAFSVCRPRPEQSRVRMTPVSRRCAALFAACLIGLPVAGKAQSIVETSDKSPQFTDRVQGLLTIGTSASHPDPSLGNKQALIAAEVRKLLKSHGVQVFAIGIKPGEPDVPKVVAEAVAKSGVSHTMSLTVPSGTVLVKRLTGETIAAKAYEVQTQLSDVKSGAVVWTHTAQVDASFFLGASIADVANAIVARMRVDGVI